MALTFTSDLSVADVRKLRLRSHDWLRIRLLLPTLADHDRLLDGIYEGALPIHGRIDQKGKVGDLVGTFWAGLYLISERSKKLLEETKITGWRAYPTICEGLVSQGALWVLGITDGAGPVRTARGIVPSDRDTPGQYLDPRDWDGSDLFHPVHDGTSLVAARAADVIEGAHLKNVLLEPGGLEESRHA